MTTTPMKSRTTAAFLALFLGVFGVHRFYLKQTGLGLFYLFFNFATIRVLGLPISAILGVIDAIVLFFMSDEEFDRRYNKGQQVVRTRQKRRTRRDRVRQRRSPHVPQQRRRKRHALSKNPFKLSGKKKLEEFEIQDAITDLKKSLEISPEDYETHYLLARAYSLKENAPESFRHLSLAIQHGFKDYDGIKTDEALAYIRIHKDFDAFEQAGYRVQQPLSTDAGDNTDATSLAQLQKLVELRKKGLITEEDFKLEKKRILR